MTAPESPPVYAGFWIRAGAVLLDTAVMSLILVPFFIPVFSYTGPGGELIRFLLNWIVPGIVSVLCWHYLGGTPGKRALGLRIADATSLGPVSSGRLVNRYLGYVPSTLVLGLGFFWVGWDKKKQGWHDLFADTVVVRDPAAPRRRWWMFLAGILVVELAVGAVLGTHLWKTQLSGMKSRAADVRTEGLAFGRDKQDGECLAAALERDAAVSGFGAHILSGGFLDACLEASQRTEAFCSEVPRDSDIMATVAWRKRLCEQAGRTDPYCGNLIAQAQWHCWPRKQENGRT